MRLLTVARATSNIHAFLCLVDTFLHIIVKFGTVSPRCICLANPLPLSVVPLLLHQEVQRAPRPCTLGSSKLLGRSWSCVAARPPGRPRPSTMFLSSSLFFADERDRDKSRRHHQARCIHDCTQFLFVWSCHPVTAPFNTLKDEIGVAPSQVDTPKDKTGVVPSQVAAPTFMVTPLVLESPSFKMVVLTMVSILLVMLSLDLHPHLRLSPHGLHCQCC